MTITAQSQRRIRKFFVLSLIAILAACGGGGSGGGDKKTQPAITDTTPETFSFVSQVDVMRNISVTSAATTISGINAAATIGISGAEYSINGGAFTSSDGTISNGQTVAIKMTSSSALATAKTATLRIGGVAAEFSVTTLADTAAPSAKIMFPSPVSMTEGDSVLVRGTASDSLSSIAEVKVNNVRAETIDNYANWQVRVPLISGVNSLSVSTRDSAGNTATAASASITSTIILKNTHEILLDSARGRLLLPDADDNIFIAVDLVTGARTKFSERAGSDIELRSVSGAILDAAHNRILLSSNYYGSLIAIDLLTGARSLFGEYTSGKSIVLDAANNRALILDNNSLEALDLASGNVTVISDYHTPDAVNLFVDAVSVALDAANNRALVVDHNIKALIAVNLSTGARTIVSDYSATNAVNPLRGPTGMAIDTDHNRVLISDIDVYATGRVAIIAIDLTSGARTVFSDNTTPDTFNSLHNSNDIVIDSANNRALVVQGMPGNVMALDLNTGARRIITQVNAPDSANLFANPDEIIMDAPRNRALVADYGLNAIVAVDVNTGARTLLSSNKLPNANNPFAALGRIALDASNNRLLAADGTTLIAVSLINGDRTILSSNTIPSGENAFSAIDGITVDTEHQRALVTDSVRKAVIAVNLITGARTIFSDNTSPNNATPFVNIGGITLDPAHNRALIIDVFNPGDNSSVVALDLTSGTRTIISNRSISSSYYHSGHAITFSAELNRALITDDGCCGDYRVAYSLNIANGAELKSIGEGDSTTNSLFSPRGIAWDGAHNCVLITDNYMNAVVLVDLVTLERVYLSK